MARKSSTAEATPSKRGSKNAVAEAEKPKRPRKPATPAQPKAKPVAKPAAKAVAKAPVAAKKPRPAPKPKVEEAGPKVVEVTVTPISAEAVSKPECRVFDNYKDEATDWNAVKRELSSRGYEVVEENLDAEPKACNLVFDNSGVHIRVFSKLDLDAYLNGRPPTHCENL